MQVKLFNSMTNKVELFQPIRDGEVSMYVCGPTVYGYVHIGNLRPVVTFDVLRRFLTHVGYKVTYISNITDVDDKIIKAAQEEETTELELTRRYMENYFMCTDKIGSLRPTYTPLVTHNMDSMIAFVRRLEEMGFAYAVDGDVYFRVNKVDHYGQLANISIEDLRVGARVEENKKKENPLDFALWKKTSEGISWDSPWGEGRPGWHTECVVLINQIYEDGLIDIHGGGFDLKFPHHENEIAQAKACFGHSLANYWMHNGFINIDNVKMSKSIGNVRLAKDLLEEYDGPVLRLAMLTSHYRAPLNFTEAVFDTAKKELAKIINPIRMANIRMQRFDLEYVETVETGLMNRFLEALADDLNTANALTVLFEVIKEINLVLRKNNREKIPTLFNTAEEMLSLLGIFYERVVLTTEDIELFQQWEELHLLGDYEHADEIRQQLIDRGLL